MTSLSANCEYRIQHERRRLNTIVSIQEVYTSAPTTVSPTLIVFQQQVHFHIERLRRVPQRNDGRVSLAQLQT